MKKKLKISKSLTKLLNLNANNSNTNENKINHPLILAPSKPAPNEEPNGGALVELLRRFDAAIQQQQEQIQKLTASVQTLNQENQNLKKQIEKLEIRKEKPVSKTFLEAAKSPSKNSTNVKSTKNFHLAIKVQNAENINDSWLISSCNLPKNCEISNIQLLTSKKFCKSVIYAKNFHKNSAKCAICTNKTPKPNQRNPETSKCAICTDNNPPYKSFKVKITAPAYYTLNHFMSNPSFFPQGTLITKFRFPNGFITGKN